LVACDEPGNADYLLFMPDARLSEPAFRLAAEFVKAEPDRRVLLYNGYVRRAAAIQAEPPFDKFVALELQEHGVPTDAIEVIQRPESVTYSEMYQDLWAWLQQATPQGKIMLVTHRFKAGYMQRMARKALTKEQRSQISVVGLPAMGIDEHNWYRGAAGIKWVAVSYLSWIHLSMFGEFHPTYDWDPDAYERTLAARAAHPSLE
jgi:hypothetical protein